MTTNTNVFHILLAEDNAADVLLVREALREADLDCALHLIKDGAEAIAFIERLDADTKKPALDMMLLDMHLPRRDGEEILKRLRSTDNYAQTPVIVMTASDAPRDHESATRNAALHYFRKPSDLTGFMEIGVIVRNILANSRPDDSFTTAAEKEGHAA